MKSVFLFFLLIMSWTAQANDLVKGYIVLSGQDTLQCQIKLRGKSPVTDYTTLVIINEQGEEKVYKAKEKKVRAYGFDFSGVQYDYRFVEIKKTYESGFFRLIENGKNYKLYENKVSSTNNSVTVTHSHYVIFKSNGEYVDLTTHLLGKWKKNLEAFFEEDQEALKKLENVSRLEIPQFIRSLNEVQ